jgi:hypothetical protein
MPRQITNRLKWPTVLLALGNIVSVWAGVTRLWQGSETQLILATAALQIATPNDLQDPIHTAIDLTAVQSAALFYESRSFYIPPVAPRIQAPPPDYKLSGTLVIPKQPTIAMLIQNRSGARIKVRAGEDLEGWTVESIQAQGVMLRHEDQQYEIRSAARAPAAGMQPMPLSGTTLQGRPRGGAGIKLLGSPLTRQRSQGF